MLTHATSFVRKTFVCIFGLLLAIGCTRHTETASNGGQDGGGGHIMVSTAAEVHAAINEVLTLARDPNFISNIFFSYLDARIQLAKASDPNWAKALSLPDPDPGNVSIYWDSAGKSIVYGVDQDSAPLAKSPGNSTTDDDNVPKSIKIIYNIFTGRSLRCAAEFHSDLPSDCGAKANRDSYANSFQNYFVTLMTQTKIRFNENGDCGKPNDNHADASVDHFSPGSPICFSIPNLRKIPASSLQHEISALLIHEVAHLGGYGENVAQVIQADFWEFFDLRFLKDGTVHIDISQLFDGLETLKQGLCFPETAMSDAEFIFRLSEIVTTVNSMPFARDPRGLVLSYHSPNSKAAIGYANAIQKLIAAFPSHRDIYDVWTGEEYGYSAKAAATVGRTRVSLCSELEQRLEIVMQNLDSATLDDGTNPICLETGSTGIDLHVFPQAYLPSCTEAQY